MRKDKQLLKKIYMKTDGLCHICHRRLSLHQYGKAGEKGAWHIEHSIPKAKGGTDHLNNLFPACIGCNIEKGIMTSRTARNYNGNTRAPYSKKKKAEIKDSNTTAGALVGGGIGLAFGGPVGGIIGSFIGGVIGSSSSPKY
ncbi:MAG: HNH endonuclease signature motif containing protein [Cyclobacteriaceae bacterium]